jgi:hypothetical protein
VVVVSSSVVADGCRIFGYVFKEINQRHTGGFIALEGQVQVVDIGGVVSGVVNVHGSGINVGLQSLEFIGQGREGIRCLGIGSPVVENKSQKEQV